jgi:hypothetical protein
MKSQFLDRRSAPALHITVKEGEITLEGQVLTEPQMGIVANKGALARTVDAHDVVGRTIMALLPKRKAIVKKMGAFPERLKGSLNQEIHIKCEQDENPVNYRLREILEDFLVVDYGESQRLIPINKIIFVQIGSYPKES